MGDLRELYQQIILDHNRAPRNFKLLEDANHEAAGDNPLCGDKIHVYLRVEDGVAIRTGHHCAQPVMDFYGVPATARASMAFYNTRGDVDALVGALDRAREVFG